jgi:hypothetical protein
MSYTYSFLDVQCAINGPGGSVILGDGSGASDEGITFDPSGPINTMQIGADGSGQHSLHGDVSGKVTVRILKTSPTNSQLMAMYNVQTSSSASHGQNTISLTDSARGDSITASMVAFSKVPNITYAKEAGTYEWEFEAITIHRMLGT